MTKYITAAVLVGRLIEEHGSLFVQGENLALLVQQLAACDRETAILEREISHLAAENQRVRLQIQQRDVEIYRLRAVAQLVRELLDDLTSRAPAYRMSLDLKAPLLRLYEAISAFSAL